MKIVRVGGSLLALLVFFGAAMLAVVAQTGPSTTRRAPSVRAEAPAPSMSAIVPGMHLATSTAHPIPVMPRYGAQRGKSRTLKSLNGSTIILSSPAPACFPTVNGSVITDTTNFQVGCGITWTPANLNSGYTSGGATANYTDYYLAPGATTATQVGTAGYAAGAATGHSLTNMVAGTYVFGTYDNVNNVWDALLYMQIGTLASLDTYLDSQLTNADGIVAIGNPVYIVASGLTPQHLYVISIENTGSTGQCVYIAPNTSGTTSLTNGPQGKLCNDAAANTTGTYAAGDDLTFTWTPPNGTVAGYQGGAVSVVPGTYTISVFDQTASQRIATRQFVVSAVATSTAPFPTVQFFGNPGTLPATVQTAPNTPARIAWNGGSSVPHYDASNNYLNIGIGAANIYATDNAGAASFLVTLSDPNGKVVYKNTSSNYATSVAPSSQQTALPTTMLDFAAEYPTSTWTAGLFQLGHTNGVTTATPVPLGVRSVKILSYAGTAGWVPTGGGNQSVLLLPTTPANTGYPEQITFSNVGDLAFGVTNADPIKQFVTTFPTGAFTTLSWYTNSSTTPAACPSLTVGGTGCSQSVIVNTSTGATTGNLDDSNGSPWTATLTCTDSSKANGSACGGATTTYTLSITPNSASTPLAPGAYITTPYLFVEAFQGTNPCATTCTATNALYPSDGFALSSGTKVINTLGIQYGTAGATNLTSSLYYLGYFGGPTYGVYPTGYAPRPGSTSAPAAGFNVTAGHAVMPQGQPFSASGAAYIGLDVKDANTSTSDYIQSFEAQFPPNFDISTASVFEITYSGTNGTGGVTGVYNMGIIAPGTNGCPANFLCWKQPGSGAAFSGTNCTGVQNIMAGPNSTNLSSCTPSFVTYFITINLPTKSFSYTDVAISVIYGSSGNVPVASVSKTIPVFVGTPNTIDSNAIGSYSLNAAEMLGTLNPSTIGSGISTTVNFSLQNTTTALDPFPDYLDAYVVQLPTNATSTIIAANGVPSSCATVTVNTANWSCVTTVANSPSGYNTYWFVPTGCSELYNSTLPPAGANVAGGNLPGGTTETSSAALTFSTISSACTSILKTQALLPGGQNSVSFPITTSGATPAPGATPLPVYAYAHGANTNSWSNPLISSLQVANTAQVTAGFTAAGGYTTGTPTSVGNGQEPTIGADTNTTYGGSYIYSLSNVGGVNIKSAVITIPYEDTGGNGSAAQWSVDATPTLTGGNGSCTVSYTNPTSSANGNITIGGTGCIIATNNTVTLRFNAKSPGQVNSTYQWSAKVTDTGNNTVAAQENWFSDTLVFITTAASLTVAVNSSPTCSYSTGNSVVSINTGTNTMNFGTIFPTTTSACLDAAYVQVSTNAAKPIGWVVYAQITGNVAVAGSAPSGLADELSIRPSATVTNSYNYPGSNTWISYPSSSYNIATGSGNAGIVVMKSDGSGPSSSSPTTLYNGYIDLQLSTGTEGNTPATNQASVVFTWISS